MKHSKCPPSNKEVVSVNKRFVPDARPTVTGTKKMAALSFSFLTHMSILTMVMVTLRLVRTMLMTMMIMNDHIHLD